MWTAAGDTMTRRAAQSDINFRLEHPDYISDPIYNSTSAPEKLLDMTSVMVMKKGLSVAGTVLDTKGQPIQGSEGDAGVRSLGDQVP